MAEKKKRIYIETYGCQMNVSDSEVVLGILSEAGHEVTTSLEDADVVLVNTCSVRENAEQRVYGRLGEFKRLKARKPEVVVGLLGCMAERLRGKLSGVGSAFDVAYGIVHAVERGAQVLNMSLGLSSPSSAVAAAIRFARDRGVGGVVPTGHDEMGSLSSPAAMSEVVAVAGTDSLDQHAWFTNYGYGTDIAAPAMGILSTYYGGGYARWSGTSMAAPFVSGTAALLYGLMLPGDASTPGQVQSYLLQGAYSLYSIDPGFAWGLGAGRGDAARSVNAVSWGGDAVVEEQERRP